MDWKKISWYIYPLAALLLLMLFSFGQAYQFLDMRLYDLMLKFRPTPQENERILLVEIDDKTIGDVGTYPLGREVVADGTVQFWEYGTSYVVFDSQFIDTSPRGVNESWLRQEMPRSISLSLSEVESFGSGLADALASGQLPPDALSDYLQDYRDYTAQMEQQILDSVQQVVLDKDQYLGERIALLGNAIITIGTQDNYEDYVSDSLRQLAVPFALDPVEMEAPPVGQAVDIRPSIAPISRHALALGFPRVHIDEDGVRRQIDLLYQWEGHLFPQLGLSTLIQWLNPSSYRLDKNNFTLNDVTLPDGSKVEELTIPLSRSGRMYINWPHKSFEESFRHFSFYSLHVQNVYEKSLMDNLYQLKSWGILSMYDGEDPLMYLDYARDYLNQALIDKEGLSAEEYRQIRDAGFQALLALGESSLEADGLAEIEGLLENPGMQASEKEALASMAEALPLIMGNIRSLTPELIRLRTESLKELQHAVVILGYTGESTQDIGVTPFEKHYMNMGLHGAVINTILQQDFLDDLPHGFSLLLGALLSALLVWILAQGKTWRSMAMAIGIWMLGLSALVLMFRFTGIYPGILFPLLSTIATSIILLVVKFLRENQEKGFIKNAFGQYLSSEVIDTIIQDPSKLSLGGAQKELTAIFTDIKGFSTISEQLSPTQLVQLLNRYLTSMSDIVLDNKGTIDKFEGDAIIAFFGAPHELKHHATAALSSALQMKKVEAILNHEFLTTDPPLTPGPLLTRVGVNTGQMVVGNMGTVRKMDYTIMGSAVNLAARLEGVNKQYNTWILASHFTYHQAEKDVVARALDKVRVVGINEPVQLYQVMEEKAFATRSLMDQIELFEEAMKFFRMRKWEEAQKEFQRYLEIFPNDGAASLYFERSGEYLKKPPSDNWDGVYNLTKK